MSLSTPSPGVEGVQPFDASQRSTLQRNNSTRERVPSAAEQGLKSGTPQNPPRARAGVAQGGSKSVLPFEKVFPVQIGSEIFRLSGASISSDAPSYFSQFFEGQIRENGEDGPIRTLYIDRDPLTFRDIARHLQGYHIKPQDGAHFVKLFADAQFYSLPRLISQLFESEIFIQIGDRHFQIPRDIFSSPGDSPNFFSLGFAVFFSTPGEAFPGLDRRGLLRPPTIVPPSVPNRSAEIFAQLLHMLRGYPFHIRDDEHRQELLRDCRYFHLRGLEQKLIACDISYNVKRGRSEITLKLDDIRPSGISFVTDSSDGVPTGGSVQYARPFVDENASDLIIEIAGESTILDVQNMRADFHGSMKARVASLTQVVANKLNLPNSAPLGLKMLSGGSSVPSPGNTPLSDDMVKVSIDKATDVVLDGEVFEMDGPPEVDGSDHSNTSESGHTDHADHAQSSRPSRKRTGPPAEGPPTKRRKQNESSSMARWVVRRGQWRLRVQVVHDTDGNGSRLEIIFIAVKLEAYSSERSRNVKKAFLT